jgi:hypothetical protein
MVGSHFLFAENGRPIVRFLGCSSNAVDVAYPFNALREAHH